MQALNGVTIQVVHSDAEGRMVLADTLALAAREKPALLLDFATLTGACVNALTERYSGAFTNHPALEASLVAAGRASGERVWCFPMERDFDTELESTIADVMQCALGIKGDHILAARFLNRFVPRDVPLGARRPCLQRAQGRAGAHPHRVHRLRRALCDATARRRRAAPRAGADPVTALRIRRPDDWHLHLRDGAHMAAVLPLHGGSLCPRAGHAEPEATDDHHRVRSRSTARASCRPCRPGWTSSRS